ncbi:AraC family transcriptional regulator [Martelella alba]|uniref:AraC family transcriptional regulator n=1 Tax=Martelella alba TaxID=2590451 RepID=A0A506UH02_9HYPH|nr:AraC family transcriptional regulator [Martelella alba]TPW31807.1 AraC family transcriptional regulator [Martelella alba]
MIERSEMRERYDRLSAFLKAFALSASYLEAADEANLLIVDTLGEGYPTELVYRARSSGPLPEGAHLLAAARVEFGGSANPLIGALPDQLCFSLAGAPQLYGLSELIVAEVATARCGGGTIKARLCEVIVVLAIRRAIAIGTVNAGLLAGLAHPALHKSLVAMHDAPERRWLVSDLAAIAGMSRGTFTSLFSMVVGETPAAYLNGWRLALGRAELLSGRSVKTAAARVGFGSAAAFSRAFTRKYGYPPGRTVADGVL